MYVGKPSSIEIKPFPDKTRFRFRLLGSSVSAPTVEFDVSGEGLMRLMTALRQLQALHKLPIPPNSRPQGKPHLVIVPKDGEP